MNHSPKVSVIIPVYNAEKYLRQCMNSVIAQTLKDIEIICVDDGSTDNSIKILNEYKRDNSCIKIIHQQNLYAGVARNNGLKFATGEYVFFLDGDDFCNRELLSLATKTADKLKTDIVVFDHFRIDEKTGKMERRKDLFQNFLPKGIETFSYHNAPDRIMSVINPVPWNKLIRRDFLLKHALHFEALSSTNDITFSAMCAACATKIAYISEPLIYYRVSLKTSITSTKQYKLDNVLSALIATYEQARRLPYFQRIISSVQYFVVDNLYFAITNYAGNSDGEPYKTFFLKIGNLFRNHPLFWNISEESISNETLWKFFNLAIKTSEISLCREYLPKIIVSLTSYPKRINTVFKTIQTMIAQTVQPDEIVLWLAKSQFPNLEDDLPEELTRMVSNKVKIKWTQDIKSYKKLIPALIAYPDDIIITIDDDLLFDEHIIERLLKGYRKYPHCIQCHRVTTVNYRDVNNISITPDALKAYPVPTYLHKLSGGAGCLYPPHSLHPDVLRKDLFMLLAPTSDDIWFWLMGVLNGYKVNLVKNNIAKLKYIPGTQDEALWRINDRGQNLFFVHLRNILYYYPILMDVLKNEQCLFGEYKMGIDKMEEPVSRLQQRNRFLEQQITLIHQSWSYRLGRFMTWGPRMLRGLIFCFEEHGLRYTFKRILAHLNLKKNDAMNSNMKKEYERRNYDYYSKLSPDKYEKELKIWYEKITRSSLDLNNPQTFNEKIQWLKLNDSTPLKTRLADKYLVRDWVKGKIGEQYLIPLLGVWDYFEEIDFNKLPNQFVLKANHGSGWNYIVKDKNKFDKEDARKKFDIWMHRNFAFVFGLELHYMNIHPKILAEKYMADLDGDIFDYRFFCFNGNPTYVWVDVGSGTSHHKRNIYDMNWNLQTYKVNYPNIEPAPEKPETFDEMVRCARILSQGFALVRVDFYSVKNHVYFGEMTFTPQSGTGKWEDSKQNRLYGDLIKLPPKSPIPERKIF